jgi:hypothetical protein
MMADASAFWLERSISAFFGADDETLHDEYSLPQVGERL